jgi:hypothetical protein
MYISVKGHKPSISRSLGMAIGPSSKKAYQIYCCGHAVAYANNISQQNVTHTTQISTYVTLSYKRISENLTNITGFTNGTGKSQSCPSTRHEHTWKKWYSSTHSSPKHYKDVSDQLHTPTALPHVKDKSIPRQYPLIRRLGLDATEKRLSFVPGGKRTTSPQSSSP